MPVRLPRCPVSLALLVAVDSLAAQVPVIRPTEGLILTSVVHEERGDVETHWVVHNVSPAGYDLVAHSTIPNSADPTHPQSLSVIRTIRMADDSGAHRLNVILSTGDPNVFPGSAFFLSRAMLHELESAGKTSAIVGDAPPGAFTNPLAVLTADRQYYRGDLSRVGPTRVSVIVNDTATELPAVESRGHLSVAGQNDEVDIVTLDNPAWPVTLRWSSQGRQFQMTEIEWPDSGTTNQGKRRGRLAQMLGSACRVEVHGIYFAFASAELMPQSDPALKQVAATLNAHPDWMVTIEGHTDSIGTHASNLDLSKRRAAAVQDALVSRFGIAAARLSATGYGDARPVAPNATIEGRARNRRVELARKC